MTTFETAFFLLILELLFDQIQRAAGLEPFDLLLVVSVIHHHPVL